MTLSTAPNDKGYLIVMRTNSSLSFRMHECVSVYCMYCCGHFHFNIVFRPTEFNTLSFCTLYTVHVIFFLFFFTIILKISGFHIKNCIQQILNQVYGASFMIRTLSVLSFSSFTFINGASGFIAIHA